MSSCILVRTYRAFINILYLALQNQFSLGIIRDLTSILFYFSIVIIAEVIYSDAVFIFIRNFENLSFYIHKLSRGKTAFKHRILNSLTVITTNFCDFTESFSAGGFCRINIVCNQYHHFISRKTEDIRLYLLSKILQATMPEHEEQDPIRFFLQETGEL